MVKLVEHLGFVLGYCIIEESEDLGQKCCRSYTSVACIYQLGSISQNFQNDAAFVGPSDQTHECMVSISGTNPDNTQLSLVYMKVYICQGQA